MTTLNPRAAPRLALDGQRVDLTTIDTFYRPTFEYIANRNGASPAQALADFRVDHDGGDAVLTALLDIDVDAADWPHRTAPSKSQRIGVLLSEVVPTRVSWLWPGRIPFGEITLIDGDPGLGKSAITTDLAARVSMGRPMPDGAECEVAGVVILSAEDALDDTIRPRLDAAGADTTRILGIPTIGTGDAEHMPAVPDDHDARERLTERIAELEAQRERMKAANAEYRKEHRAELKGLTKYQRDELIPYPGWALTNLGANIRRNKQRFAALDAPPVIRTIAARRDGDCEACAERITAGELISKVDGVWVHHRHAHERGDA